MCPIKTKYIKSIKIKTNMKKNLLIIIFFCISTALVAQKCKDNLFFLPIIKKPQTGWGSDKTYYASYINFQCPSLTTEKLGNSYTPKFRNNWRPTKEMIIEALSIKNNKLQNTNYDYEVQLKIKQIDFTNYNKADMMGNTKVEILFFVLGDYLVIDPKTKNIITTHTFIEFEPTGLNFETKIPAEIGYESLRMLDRDSLIFKLNYSNMFTNCMSKAKSRIFEKYCELIDTRIAWIKNFPEINEDESKKMTRNFRNCFEVYSEMSSQASKEKELFNTSDYIHLPVNVRYRTPNYPLYIYECIKEKKSILARFSENYSKYSNHENQDVKDYAKVNMFLYYAMEGKYDSALILSKELESYTKWYKQVTRIINDNISEKKLDQVNNSNFYENNYNEILNEYTSYTIKQKLDAEEAKEQYIKENFFMGQILTTDGKMIKGEIYWPAYSFMKNNKLPSSKLFNTIFFNCKDVDCSKYQNDGSAYPIYASFIKEFEIDGKKVLSKKVLVKGLFNSTSNYLFSVKENDKIGLYKRFAYESADKFDYVYYIKNKDYGILTDMNIGKLADYFSECPFVMDAIEGKKIKNPEELIDIYNQNCK